MLLRQPLEQWCRDMWRDGQPMPALADRPHTNTHAHAPAHIPAPAPRCCLGNTYVELGVDQPQECRRCKTATLAHRKRDLEGRRDDDDDDDDDRERGEHKADLCRMCQRLRRLKGPHARCDEGRRRGHRFGDGDDYF